MFVTFLLFESNLYVVLAREKGPKNSVHRDLFKTKNPKQKVFRNLRMWSYLLKKSLMENFIFVQRSVKILDLAFFQEYNLGVTKIIGTMEL